MILDTCEYFKSCLLGLLLFYATNSNTYSIEKKKCIPYYIEWSVKGDLTDSLVINPFSKEGYHISLCHIPCERVIHIHVVGLISKRVELF